MAKGKCEQRHNFFKNNLRIVLATAFFILAAIFAALWFSTSYTDLNRSIQNERVESMEQIGTIILEKIQLLSNSYTSELELISELFMDSDIDTLEDANRIFGKSNDLYVFREDMKCFDLSGSPVYFVDVQAIFKGISDEGVYSQFGSIRTRGDYWIFSIPIFDVTLDGVAIVGLLKLVDASTYAEITTNLIFGNQGATYLVNSGGVVLFRPENINKNAYFQSYNILSEMTENGVDPESIELLRNALAENIEEQIVVDIHNTTWLIQSVPEPSGSNILLTVPISITAKGTFNSMSSTIFAVIVLLICITSIFFVWIFYFNRRSGEMKLQQAKANSKSDFMNKMSHDIRTPLNAIVGMISIAQSALHNEKQVDECLNSAKKSSEYLISIINDVLDMSRIENGKMTIGHEPFDLKELLDTIVQLEALPARSKELKFVLEDNTTNDVAYMGDDVRIKQCLINLVSNAIKFTPKGGTVTIKCDVNALDDKKRLVRFSVQDTGIGMSDEFMANMFEPFEQERTSVKYSGNVGSGLGLSIVYHLTDLMGGTIEVFSEKGVGSLFVIELPLEITEHSFPDENYSEASEDALCGKRVLLAEDNEINRSIVSFFLSDCGMLIEEAENGKIAFDCFTNSQSGYFDAILMDIQMPVMDGLETAKSIRACKHPDGQTIPIIALSANAFNEDVEKSHNVGMQAHLSKPIDQKQLKQTLLKYINLSEKKENSQ